MPTYRAIASFYDDEYADLEMLQRDVGFLLSRLPKRRSDVLMLACGTGRAAIPVAGAGHRVLGVDLDAAMLEIARAKAQFAAIPPKRIAFAAHDLLSMKLGRTFDVAAILFNSFLLFTTLDQQDRVLRNIHAALGPRGRLILDVFNPDLARIAEDEALNADVRTFFSRELGVGVQRITHIRATDVPQVRETTFEYRWFDPQGRPRKRRVQFELTYFFERELTMLLERNGFRVESVYGDHDGSAAGVDSERIIVEARRA
jgi:SAM-dependent methyltransferase